MHNLPGAKSKRRSALIGLLLGAHAASAQLVSHGGFEDGLCLVPPARRNASGDFLHFGNTVKDIPKRNVFLSSRTQSASRLQSSAGRSQHQSKGRKAILRGKIPGGMLLDKGAGFWFHSSIGEFRAVQNERERGQCRFHGDWKRSGPISAFFMGMLSPLKSSCASPPNKGKPNTRVN